MNKIDLAYLAGVLDSDGYFTIKRSTYGMRVVKDCWNPTFSEMIGLKQTCPIVVDLIHENFGGYRHVEKPSAKNGQPLHVVQLGNKKAALLAKAVLPYLRIKRRQAELLLELRETKDHPDKTKRPARMTNNRWGPYPSHRSVNSPAIIERRSGLLAEIRSLNDTRTHHPILL